jgi:hypothetical protein
MMKNFPLVNVLKFTLSRTELKTLNEDVGFIKNIIRFTIDALSRDVVKKHVCIMYSKARQKQNKFIKPREFLTNLLWFLSSGCVHGQLMFEETKRLCVHR